VWKATTQKTGLTEVNSLERRRPNRVQITITEILKGRCPQGFKVGDTWLFEKNITPDNMCASAFHAVYPLVKVLYYRGAIHPDGSPIYITCPDANNPVVYELKTLPPE